ncbi:uncharacterized protein [Solanum lycopersicum]|uniref:uncharacterized protein n=1 Tax=Solanum lycopersicum TaxID=4081 RepID=UPI00374A317B
MDPPQFQDGKSKDAHEFLTTCRELLKVVGLAESHGVRYATLQLRGPARDWWRTYSGVLPVGSPPVTWENFSSAFQDFFYPLECERGKSLELSRHALAIIPNDTERIHRFVRGLTFSIRSAVFRASRVRASFQSIVSAAKEAELMDREEFGDPKRARISCQFYGVSSGARGSQRVSDSFQQRGAIHASMPTFEGEQTSRGLIARLSRVGVEVPPKLEVDEEATAMISRGYLRQRPLMLLLQVGHLGRLNHSGDIDVDVILGMDCLSPYHDVLDCNAMIVTLEMPGVPRVEWKSVSGSYPSKVISFIHDHRLVETGCLSYLAFIQDTSFEPPFMDSVPVVQEFPDVFPSDLQSVPPNRDINFDIDLEMSTKPISIPPYCMAPAELS